MTARTFAFLVHPRRQLAADLGSVWAPLGRIPERYADHALRRLPLPPVRIASIALPEVPDLQGHLILVPFGAAHLMAEPGEGRRRIGKAVDQAVRLGAEVVGLGALTAPVTAGGLALRTRSDIGVTNGNAYTAAIVDAQARSVLAGQVGPVGGHVAVVGATGSVGSAVVRLLARDRAVERLTLVARSAGRREALREEISRSVPVASGCDLSAVLDADVVVLLTASADALLRAEHLKPGAVVIDATQPRNTDPGLLTQRPDVVVLDGGIVEVPSLRISSAALGLPRGQVFACLAETMLVALGAHRGHFSLGNPDLATVDAARDLGSDWAHLGFAPAAPASFGAPVPERRTPDLTGALA